MRTPLSIGASCAIVSLLSVLAGCVGTDIDSTPRAALPVAKLNGVVTVDGVLSETCYRQVPLVDSFVIAAEPGRGPARTQAWLFWNEEHLVFASDCDDSDIIASPPTLNERDVDTQDRVELFLWTGRETDAYYCIEISASGAVHDYSARFYRQFDDGWSPSRWQSAVIERPGGYRVEATISREALAAIGLELRAGQRWRVGLFRADFKTGQPTAPDWITWIEPGTANPDFHVATALGETVLRAFHP